MLAKFQKLFLDAVLNQQNSSELLDLIKPAGALSAHGVLDVYRSDYSARMKEALGKNYEATWLLVGDRDFFELTSNYISLNRSKFTSLTNYGDLFPEFLSNYKLDEEVIVMARFERVFWMLFHRPARYAITIRPESISSLCFQMENEIFIFKSPIKIYQLWQIREENNTELFLDDFLQTQYLAIFKGGEKVIIKELTFVQFQLLEILTNAGSMSVLFEKAESIGIETTPTDWAEVFEILTFCPRT